MGGMTGFRMTVYELFNIANMAEKYQIDALKESVKKALEAYPLDENNVVICASYVMSTTSSVHFFKLNTPVFLCCWQLLRNLQRLQLSASSASY